LFSYESPINVGRGTFIAETDLFDYKRFETLLFKEWAEPTERYRGLNVVGWSNPTIANRTPEDQMDIKIFFGTQKLTALITESYPENMLSALIKLGGFIAIFKVAILLGAYNKN
jgi:hypothetical protein